MFWLEVTANICILVNILRARVHRSPYRLFLSIALALLWTAYEFFRPIPIPSSFAILAILIILLAEPLHFKLCWGLLSCLSINILSHMLSYLLFICTPFQESAPRSFNFFSDYTVLLAFIIVSLYCKRKYSEKPKFLQDIRFKGYCLMGVVAFIDFFLSSVSSLLFSDSINMTGRYFLIIAIFMMIYLSVLLLMLYFRLQHAHQLLQQTDEMNRRMLQYEERHYRDLQKKNEDLRAFRHDYNYHVQVLQELAASDNPDTTHKLRKYVKELSDVKDQFFYLSVNHPVADAIVNYFYESVAGIAHLEIEGKFPERLFVSDIDLCTVLSNLLRNAADAVKKLPEGSPARIYLSLYSDDHYLSIFIENTSNPYDREFFDELPTSKDDTVNHGFGLKNVRETINRYHGNLDIQYKDNIFSVCAYLRNIN